MAGSASRCQAKTKSPARTARPSDHSAFRSLKVQVTVPSPATMPRVVQYSMYAAAQWPTVSV